MAPATITATDTVFIEKIVVPRFLRRLTLQAQLIRRHSRKLVPLSTAKVRRHWRSRVTDAQAPCCCSEKQTLACWAPRILLSITLCTLHVCLQLKRSKQSILLPQFRQVKCGEQAYGVYRLFLAHPPVYLDYGGANSFVRKTLAQIRRCLLGACAPWHELISIQRVWVSMDGQA
jgi:hypothetical protein